MKFVLLATAVCAALITNVCAYGLDWNDAIYFGYGSGWHQTQFNTTANVASNGNLDKHFSANSGAWLNNLYFGVANQALQGWYWSVELNANYTNARALTVHNTASQSETHNVAVKAQWSSDIDVLFGHTLDNQNHWLGYIKAGSSLIGMRVDYQANSGSTGIQLAKDSATKPIIGALIGVGTRYDLTTHWLAGLEGDYIYYPDQGVSQNMHYNGTEDTRKFEFNPSVLQIKATITYRF